MRTYAFRLGDVRQEKLNELFDFLGVSGLNDSERVRNFIDKAHLALLGQSESTSGQLTELNQTGATKQIRQETSPRLDTPNRESKSPFDFPCNFRTLVTSTKRDPYVLCKEVSKLPINACLNRQKRYREQAKECLPIVDDRGQAKTALVKQKAIRNIHCALNDVFYTVKEVRDRNRFDVFGCYKCPNTRCKDTIDAILEGSI